MGFQTIVPWIDFQKSQYLDQFLEEYLLVFA